MTNTKTKVLTFGPSTTLRTNGERSRTIEFCALVFVIKMGVS